MSDEKDLINKINRDRSKDIPIIGKSKLSSIHDRVINKTMRIDEIDKKSRELSMQKKVDSVIDADQGVRKSIRELVDSLDDLNDNEIAMKLIGEHIMILSEIFKGYDAKK